MAGYNKFLKTFIVLLIFSTGSLWAQGAKEDPKTGQTGNEKQGGNQPGKKKNYGENFGLFQPEKEQGKQGEHKVFYLAPPLYTFYYSGGVNYTFQEDNSQFGAIALLRFKRTTNFTFYDLQINSFIIPGQNLEGQDGPIDYYGLVRFKKSQKFFDWPYIYEWSIYQVKTSTIENVTRAIVETGYGSFIWRGGKGARKFKVNLELGITFDYSSLEAYSSNLASGFGKSGVELDFDYDSLSGKALLYYYHEIINPDPDQFANQTRLDLETSGSYHFTRNVYASVGLIFTRYLSLEKQFLQRDSLLIEQALTTYMVATYKHKFNGL